MITDYHRLSGLQKVAILFSILGESLAITLIEKIVAAPDRKSLIAGTRALDRVLLWGHYVIPLFYRPTDWVAYQANLGRPDITPVYGYVTEAWWYND